MNNLFTHEKNVFIPDISFPFGFREFFFLLKMEAAWLRFSDVTVNEKLFSGVSGRTDAFAVSEFNRAWNEMTGDKLLSQKNIADNSLVFALAKDKVVRTMRLSAEMEKAW